jgi:hypothetical protein
MSLHFSRLLLERYKAFQQPCNIEIRPLTILVGANNAGKSALARAMPLLAGGLQRTEPSAKAVPLPLASFGLTHGDSFEELIAGRSVHGSIRLEADFRAYHQGLSLTVVVQNVVSPGEETRQVITQWGFALSGGNRINIERPSLDSNEHQLTITVQGTEVEHRGEVNWAGLIPHSNDLQLEAPEHQWLKEALTALSVWALGVRYLRSPRYLVGSPFRTPSSPPLALSVSGREAPLMLAARDELLQEVQGWFSSTFGVKLVVKQRADTSIIEVLQAPGRTPVSIAQAGQGLSQVLPVAIHCMTAAGLTPGVDILEHPEAELHPRAHSAIADLIVAHLPGHARPVVVETHSEVLLLRVRRKVAEGVLNPDDVAIYWIDRDDEEGSAAVQKVEINESGDVSNWPEGVFQEDYEEVVAIRRAARHRGER